MNLSNMAGNTKYYFGLSNRITFSVHGMEMCDFSAWHPHCYWLDAVDIA